MRMEEIYNRVTERVLSLIDGDTLTWKKAHNAHGSNGAPKNITTKKGYKGCNFALLLMEQLEKGFISSEWGTFKQWKAKNETIKKGSKGTVIYFFKTVYKDADGKDCSQEEAEEKYFLPRAYTVFNRQQTTAAIDTAPLRDSHEIKEVAEQIFTSWKNVCPIEYELCTPHYNSTEDYIKLPEPLNWKSSENFYKTLFHEIGHSTGAAHRLNREYFQSSRTPEGRAREELTAEFTSLFLCSITGIQTEATEEQGTAYIQHWSQGLKTAAEEDKILIYKAIKDAQKASDYITALCEVETIDTVEEEGEEAQPVQLPQTEEKEEEEKEPEASTTPEPVHEPAEEERKDLSPVGKFESKKRDSEAYKMVVKVEKEVKELLPIDISRHDISYDLAYLAHHAKSFSPENRAYQRQSDYLIMMKNAYTRLEKWAKTEDQKKELKTGLHYIKVKLIENYSTWLNAETRTMSAMITGSSNFPTAKNEKMLNRAHSAMETMSERHEYYIKQAIKHIKKASLEGQMSDIERARYQLQNRKEIHAAIKEVNSIMRKKGTQDKKVEEIKDLLFKVENFDKITKQHSYATIDFVVRNKGFDSYMLTNNNANIKRLEKRVAELERKEAAALQQKEGKEERVLYSGANVYTDYKENRVKIEFEEKPAQPLINELKTSGWRWSPKNQVWQRAITNNSLWSAQRILKKHLGEPKPVQASFLVD